SQGVSVRADALDHRARRLRVRLPTYPFEKKRFWVEPQIPAVAAAVPPSTLVAPATPEFPMSVTPETASPAAPADRR
ncbi:hypothetical protein Q0P11_14970, partial [Staphylococcus aureus]|nr:hypothetical protein [Staphylococcus aureus]